VTANCRSDPMTVVGVDSCASRKSRCAAPDHASATWLFSWAASATDPDSPISRVEKVTSDKGCGPAWFARVFSRHGLRAMGDRAARQIMTRVARYGSVDGRYGHTRVLVRSVSRFRDALGLGVRRENHRDNRTRTDPGERDGPLIRSRRRWGTAAYDTYFFFFYSRPNARFSGL